MQNDQFVVNDYFCAPQHAHTPGNGSGVTPSVNQ